MLFIDRLEYDTPRLGIMPRLPVVAEAFAAPVPRASNVRLGRLNQCRAVPWLLDTGCSGCGWALTPFQLCGVGLGAKAPVVVRSLVKDKWDGETGHEKEDPPDPKRPRSLPPTVAGREVRWITTANKQRVRVRSWGVNLWLRSNRAALIDKPFLLRLGNTLTLDVPHHAALIDPDAPPPPALKDSTPYIIGLATLEASGLTVRVDAKTRRLSVWVPDKLWAESHGFDWCRTVRWRRRGRLQGRHDDVWGHGERDSVYQ